MNSPATDASMARYTLTKTAQSLLGICAGLTADGHLNDAEIAFLRTWISQNIEVTTVWPGSSIAARIEKIMEDGVISDDERADLLDLLQNLSGNEFSSTGSAAVAGPSAEFDDVEEILFADRTFCLTGTFFFGTRPACEKIIKKSGGLPTDRVTRSLDYLIVGSACCEQWANTTYGRKIEAAIKQRQKTGKPIIITEKTWLDRTKEG